MKSRIFVTVLLSLALAACSSQSSPKGADLYGLIASALEGMRPQAPGELTPSPAVDPFNTQVAYLSPDLGIQFSYPLGWYLQELPASDPPAVVVSTFDPADPPHKLERSAQDTQITFTFKVLFSPPASLEAWVESARQEAVAAQLTLLGEEQLDIAGQPAIRLILVSGSGGSIHQVLTELGGRYMEITIEGNFETARPVLASIQPFWSQGPKAPDSGMPASGACSDPEGEPVTIVLGIAPDGIPLAGRCLAVNPSQRILLVNQASGPFAIMLSHYAIQLPAGGALLLDSPVGEFLTEGVHFLPRGPELWVRSPGATVPPVATMPGPYSHYANSEVGISLTLSGWSVDEHGLTSPNKEIIFFPFDAEPFITYLSISHETRTLDQVDDLYTRTVPEAVREETHFNGHWAVRYTYPHGRLEYFIPVQNRLFLIITDRPTDSIVQMMMNSIQFTPVTAERFMDPELGYSLAVPSGWVVDQIGRGNPNREIRFHPVPPEPFIAYLDIGIDPRSLDAIRAQSFQDAQKFEITYAGQSGVHVLYTWGRSEMYLPYRGRVYYLFTDRAADENVIRMLGSFSFLP